MATPCYRLSIKSLKNLEGVHTDLVRVVVRAIQITPVDFTVHEGLRAIARQKALIEAGKSWTLKSRHLTGHAVDLWALPLDWHDLKRWEQMADAMKRASAELDVPIECGADWRRRDYPHFQLLRRVTT